MDIDKNSVAGIFTTLMDYRDKCSFQDLSDDAVLDWFGRSLFGREAIINFLKTHVPRSHHFIESVKSIPPISHRILKRLESFPTKINNDVVECGQGDCKGMATPENIVQPNYNELIKAPGKTRYQRSSDPKLWQFLELQGKLELEHDLYDGKIEVSKKNINKIIIAYTDQIHLIVYEGKNHCRKKLATLF